jgi:type II secretory pathway pseudopilin PulG
MERYARKTQSEAGLTLVEMIVAMAMAIVITGAAVAMMVSALNRQPDLTERGDKVGDASVAVEKLVREIRQGVVGSVATGLPANQLQFETYVDGACGSTTVTTGTKCKVSYQCESEKCTRTTGSGTTATTTIATGVRNSDNFEYVTGTSPCSKVTGEPVSFVAVKIELKSKKGGIITLSDGAGLRSCP